MAVNKDRRALAVALDAAFATPLQVRMAAILLAVNGIENALTYAVGVKEINRGRRRIHAGGTGAAPGEVQQVPPSVPGA